MGFGAQSWGTSGFGTQGVSTSTSDFNLTAVEPIAKDLVRIFFSEAIVVNPAFLNVNNYILQHTLDGSPVEVKKVIPPKDGSLVTLYVLLHTVTLVEEVKYNASVVNLISRSGATPDALSTVVWEYKRTKTDSILSSMPNVYDKRPTSNIRNLLTAISLIDNKIGGNPAEGT